MKAKSRLLPPLAVGLTVALACLPGPRSVQTNPAVEAEKQRPDFDGRINKHSSEMLKEGRKIFRYDTFGSEDFWGGKLRLHQAILGEKLGGVGPGLTPKQALQAGLKVDTGQLAKILVEAITEPGWPMHTASEMGIDDFQASRSPDKKFYRTTPLKGLFVREKGGFYHDGRFADLPAVVAHYTRLLGLGLTEPEKADLVQYLKSL